MKKENTFYESNKWYKVHKYIGINQTKGKQGMFD